LNKIIIKTDNYLPHQKEFFFSNERTKALVSGFGAGKTFVFLRETFKNHLTKLNPKTEKSKGWIVYPTLQLAHELFVEPFSELLENAKINFKFNKSASYFETVFGSIRIFSLQTPKRFVGSELTFCGFDEFDVESISNCTLAFKKATGRLRGCDNPTLYIVTTPEGFKATYNIFKKEQKGKLFNAKSTDNPHLPESYIDDLRKQYDEILLDQYLNGQFVNLLGHNAFWGFKRDLHVIKQNQNWRNHNTYHIGMDFNVNPMSATVSYLENGNLYTFDEIKLMSSNTFNMVDVLKSRYPNKKLLIYPDMSGEHKHTSSSISDFAILIKAGFEIVRGRINTHKDSLNIVNLAFTKEKIFISENCQNIVLDLEQVVTNEYGQIDKRNPELTHFSDGYRYKIERIYNELIFEKANWRIS